MKCNFCDKDKSEKMFNKKDLIIGKCRECNNKCDHGKRRNICIECNGSQLCKHGKEKCKECNIKAFCKHSRRKAICKDCGGISICKHNRERRVCKECDGNARCEHGIIRHGCKECKGGSICEHNRIRSQCKECKGGSICEHNDYNSRCIICNPLGNFISRQRMGIKRRLTTEKTNNTNTYIGCDNQFLFNHIKSQMKDNMTLKNIHIDHIKPVSRFDLTKEEEIKKCFHWSNLQPLLVEDNLSKSNKWSDEEEENWKKNIIQI